MSSSPRVVSVRHSASPPGWELSEATVPESVIHDQAVELLKALLVAWAARRQSRLFVARNLAVRWNEAAPRIGVDPDVCVLEISPREAASLRSVRTWVPGEPPPMLAIEVVSETNADKDYSIAPDKYAASGTGELWIFDPLLTGPTKNGGPFRIQIWQRNASGELFRSHAGEGPAFSPVLNGYVVTADDGKKLRIADDEGATRLWLTAEEEALARIAELERALSGRTSKH